MEANIKRLVFDDKGNLKEVEFYEGYHAYVENFWPAIEFIRKQLYYLNQKFPQHTPIETVESEVQS